MLTICGCSQEENLENTEIEISPNSANDYIFFEAGTTSTRGTLLKNSLNAPFSVLGYRYQGTWSAEAPQAKQNKKITYTNNDGQVVSESSNNADNYMGVFHPNNASVPTVQTINWETNVHKYTPIQAWQKNLTYTFFAWYPHNLVATDGEGNPQITYTLPTGGTREARAAMADVMTDCKIDYTKRDGMRVPFQMKHRLAVLDVKALNLVNAKALRETYTDVPEWKNIKDNETVTVDVTGLTLTLNPIKASATIPLNSNDTNEKMIASGSLNPTYTGFDGYTGLPYSINAADAKPIIGNDEKLILIPQNEAIIVTLKLSYRITCNGIVKTFTNVQPSSEIKISTLEEGKYHYLLVSITKSGLFIKAQAQNSWIEENVEHEFE